MKKRRKLRIIQVAFDIGGLWIFDDKDCRQKAILKDIDFYDKINHGESFSNGDLLDMELDTSPFPAIIYKVYEHIQPRFHGAT